MKELLHNRRLWALAIMISGWLILLFGVIHFAGHTDYITWFWWSGWCLIGAGAGAFLSFTIRGAIIGAIVLLAWFYAVLHYCGTIR